MIEFGPTGTNAIKGAFITDSIGGALLQVPYWALPGLVLYFVLAPSPAIVVSGGALLVALLVMQLVSVSVDPF